MSYRIATDPAAGDMIVRSDGAWIPPDPKNADYAAFLKWLEEGNTPEPWEPEEVPS